jgi:hypothetical protein
MILGGRKREDGVKWRVGGCLDATKREVKERDQKTNKSRSSSDYMKKVHFEAVDSRSCGSGEGSKVIWGEVWESKEEEMWRREGGLLSAATEARPQEMRVARLTTTAIGSESRSKRDASSKSRSRRSICLLVLRDCTTRNLGQDKLHIPATKLSTMESKARKQACVSSKLLIRELLLSVQQATTAYFAFLLSGKGCVVRLRS